MKLIKPRVYLSTEYTSESSKRMFHNYQAHLALYHGMVSDGVVTPVTWAALVPASHACRALDPKVYLNYDCELILGCHAILQISVSGESCGMERSEGCRIEREYAASNGIPLFTEIEALYEWARSGSWEG